MINTDVKITRPVIEVLKASDLKEGELFVTEPESHEENILPHVRCAVCLYDVEGVDTDIRTVKPFHPCKSGIDTYDELGYVSAGDTVYRVEIIASELKIVK